MLQHDTINDEPFPSPAGLPSSKELGALLQDSLYESSGLTATYAGEDLKSLTTLTHRSHLPFEGRHAGTWRIRWEDGIEDRLRDAQGLGESPRQMLTDMLYSILRRWSVRQPDLGPLMVGGASAEEPAWMKQETRNVSAALNVGANLVEISLSFKS